MKYQVLLRGENFQVTIDSRVSRHGFFATRFVEADTPDVAEDVAVGLVRGTRSCKPLCEMTRQIPR